ncbi:MAG TPA: hypothetical protein VG944_17055 [Fimbriimonas sp.]|nr:hypothetical protein [Fimbriimonas sp.]
MESLEDRVRRLERANSRLRTVSVLGCLCFAAALFGFKTQGPESLIQARKLQIVDNQGVPVVTMEPGRQGGASIVLRDESGDRRVWITSEGGTSRLGMICGDEDSPKASVGLSAEASQATLSLSGGKATGSMSVRGQKPSVELVGDNGQTLFVAPWRKN